jgi:hypothetical protein
VVMVILLVKKTPSSPPSDGPTECTEGENGTCPDGKCEAGQCRYQCNEGNCPTTCKDNKCQDPPPPTGVCKGGTTSKNPVKGICADDGTCSSDCANCDRSTCGDTCKDTQGRLVWNENDNQQCILKYDWTGIDCPANCNATSSTKPLGVQCRPGWFADTTTYSTYTTTDPPVCYGQWKITGAQSQSLCEETDKGKSGWTFSKPGGPYVCTKNT